jgi:hypothetical protein
MKEAIDRLERISSGNIEKRMINMKEEKVSCEMMSLVAFSSISRILCIRIATFDR